MTSAITVHIEHVRLELMRTRAEMHGISPRASLHGKLVDEARKLETELDRLYRARLRQP